MKKSVISKKFGIGIFLMILRALSELTLASIHTRISGLNFEDEIPYLAIKASPLCISYILANNFHRSSEKDIFFNLRDQ